MIIKSYWNNKTEEKQKEKFVENYLKRVEIKRFFISDEQVKEFKIFVNDEGRFQINYALKGRNLKYYVNLLNSSFLFFNDYIKVLYDKDWKNYDKEILNDVEEKR